MSTINETVYRPGIRAWWRYARLDGSPGFWRRARPSARLRQADRERADWKRWLDNVEDLTQAQLREAEREAVLSALNALDDLATDVGYAMALDYTKAAYFDPSPTPPSQEDIA